MILMINSLYFVQVLGRLNGELKGLKEYFEVRRSDMMSLHQNQLKGIVDMRKRFIAQFYKGDDK